MKYVQYVPLVSLADGSRFVFFGWIHEADGIITLESGEKCKRWEDFPSNGKEAV